MCPQFSFFVTSPGKTFRVRRRKVELLINYLACANFCSCPKMWRFINITQPLHLDEITVLKNNVMAPKPDKSWHAHFHPTSCNNFARFLWQERFLQSDGSFFYLQLQFIFHVCLCTRQWWLLVLKLSNKSQTGPVLLFIFFSFKQKKTARKT